MSSANPYMRPYVASRKRPRRSSPISSRNEEAESAGNEVGMTEVSAHDSSQHTEFHNQFSPASRSVSPTPAALPSATNAPSSQHPPAIGNADNAVAVQSDEAIDVSPVTTTLCSLQAASEASSAAAGSSSSNSFNEQLNAIIETNLCQVASPASPSATPAVNNVSASEPGSAMSPELQQKLQQAGFGGSITALAAALEGYSRRRTNSERAARSAPCGPLGGIVVGVSRQGMRRAEESSNAASMKAWRRKFLDRYHTIVSKLNELHAEFNCPYTLHVGDTTTVRGQCLHAAQPILSNFVRSTWYDPRTLSALKELSEGRLQPIELSSLPVNTLHELVSVALRGCSLEGGIKGPAAVQLLYSGTGIRMDGSIRDLSKSQCLTLLQRYHSLMTTLNEQRCGVQFLHVFFDVCCRAASHVMWLSPGLQDAPQGPANVGLFQSRSESPFGFNSTVIAEKPTIACSRHFMSKSAPIGLLAELATQDLADRTIIIDGCVLSGKSAALQLYALYLRAQGTQILHLQHKLLGGLSATAPGFKAALRLGASAIRSAQQQAAALSEPSDASPTARANRMAALSATLLADGSHSKQRLTELNSLGVEVIIVDDLHQFTNPELLILSAAVSILRAHAHTTGRKLQVVAAGSWLCKWDVSSDFTQSNHDALSMFPYSSSSLGIARSANPTDQLMQMFSADIHPEDIALFSNLEIVRIQCHSPPISQGEHQTHFCEAPDLSQQLARELDSACANKVWCGAHFIPIPPQIQDQTTSSCRFGRLQCCKDDPVCSLHSSSNICLYSGAEAEERARKHNLFMLHKLLENSDIANNCPLSTHVFSAELSQDINLVTQGYRALQGNYQILEACEGCLVILLIDIEGYVDPDTRELHIAEAQHFDDAMDAADISMTVLEAGSVGTIIAFVDHGMQRYPKVQFRSGTSVVYYTATPFTWPLYDVHGRRHWIRQLPLILGFAAAVPLLKGLALRPPSDISIYIDIPSTALHDLANSVVPTILQSALRVHRPAWEQICLSAAQVHILRQYIHQTSASPLE